MESVKGYSWKQNEIRLSYEYKQKFFLLLYDTKVSTKGTTLRRSFSPEMLTNKFRFYF